MIKADKIIGYDGNNPFSDNTARDYYDDEIIDEFFPVSMYWSLFNPRHEILLGTRGSGKTIMLKMMKYSLLKNISDERAKEYVESKEFITLYIPTRLDFVTYVESKGGEDDAFNIAINCLLAQSLLQEMKVIIDDATGKDIIKNAAIENNISKQLCKMWFGESQEKITDFFSLGIEVEYLYNHLGDDSIKNMSSTFSRSVCSSLMSVKEIICKWLSLPSNTKWIICIDEAEYLTKQMQKCVNSIMKSDSKGIAIKLATLPNKHLTRETLLNNTEIVAGEDFNYRVIDMKIESEDFISLTNKLCQRITRRLRSSIDVEIKDLEDFIGKEGNDDNIDYFRKEISTKSPDHNQVTRSSVEKEILSLVSEKRRETAKSRKDTRKTVYDKFSVIYFVREMRKIDKKGHSIAGWYAGSSMIRKVAQGNPRRFIEIMHMLFEHARHTKLTAKQQHTVIYKYVKLYCKATEALPGTGPEAYKKLTLIAEYIESKVHGDILIPCGNSFLLGEGEFSKNSDWIKLAIDYSRIIVSDEALINGINNETEYTLSNAFAAFHWIPMRKTDKAPKISFSELTGNINSYKSSKTKRIRKNDFADQLTFIIEENE